MAGIYIHIPFCKQACHYCNFHFSTSLQLQNGFSAALLKEAALQQPYLGRVPVHTLYFGGGTPSLLPEAELQRIIDKIREYYNLSPDAEITLEANPDDITPAQAAAWRTAGINRLSIGIQSFFEEDLRWMNRAHTAGQALQSILTVQEEGFDNITIDLIYGGPTLPDEHWHQNVQQAIDLHIPHISCYALTVEPQTALDTFIRKKKYTPVDTEDQARQFLLLLDWMENAGYEQYEISNFSLPGKRSRHNSAYWKGALYLGLGPSAHSFNGTSRQWNIANNALYIKALQNDTIPFEKEILTPVQRLNEYVMTSLRTMEGLDLRLIKEQFGETSLQQLHALAQPFMEQQKLVLLDHRLVLTKEGKLFADGIAAELFAEEE